MLLNLVLNSYNNFCALIFLFEIYQFLRKFLVCFCNFSSEIMLYINLFILIYKIHFSSTESNFFSHGTVLPEIPRSSGVSSQAEPYYLSSVSLSSGTHHPPAMASVVSPPTSWSSVTHPTSCSVSTNTLSSFSAGTLPSNSQGILPFLEEPGVSDLSASDACLYTDDLARMETSSLSPAGLYSISDVNVLSNRPGNVMTPSSDNMGDTDNPRLVSINLDTSCTSLDQGDLRQLHQMSSASMSAGTSSSSGFVSQSNAFDRANFNRVENGLINEPGPSNGANSHNFVQSSQYSSIDTLQSEQLSDPFTYSFFKI